MYNLPHSYKFTIILGSAAQAAFRGLRDKYAREKRNVSKSKVSGSATSEVNVRVSDMYAYLQWLDPYIKGRKTVSNIEARVELPSVEEDSDFEGDGIDDSASVASSSGTISKIDSQLLGVEKKQPRIGSKR